MWPSNDDRLTRAVSKAWSRKFISQVALNTNCSAVKTGPARQGRLAQAPLPITSARLQPRRSAAAAPPPLRPPAAAAAPQTRRPCRARAVASAGSPLG